MGDVRVRNLDDGVVFELRQQARRHGRSLEAELRDLLSEAAYQPRRDIAQRAAQLREAIRLESGVLPDSTRFIREERDRRG